MKSFKIGHGLTSDVTIGPLINDKGVDKVRKHVEDAVKGGAEVLVGGKVHELGGRFWEPTVLGGMGRGSEVEGEETFGPVAALWRFETEEEGEKSVLLATFLVPACNALNAFFLFLFLLVNSHTPGERHFRGVGGVLLLSRPQQDLAGCGGVGGWDGWCEHRYAR